MRRNILFFINTNEVSIHCASLFIGRIRLTTGLVIVDIDDYCFIFEFLSPILKSTSKRNASLKVVTPDFSTTRYIIITVSDTQHTFAFDVQQRLFIT